VSREEPDHANLEGRLDLGPAGTVMKWATETGIIRAENLKTGLHDVIMGNPVVTLAVMRTLGASECQSVQLISQAYSRATCREAFAHTSVIATTTPHRVDGAQQAAPNLSTPDLRREATAPKHYGRTRDNALERWQHRMHTKKTDPSPYPSHQPKTANVRPFPRPRNFCLRDLDFCLISID
jgi:hypothetical protein